MREMMGPATGEGVGEAVGFARGKGETAGEAVEKAVGGDVGGMSQSWRWQSQDTRRPAGRQRPTSVETQNRQGGRSGRQMVRDGGGDGSARLGQMPGMEKEVAPEDRRHYSNPGKGAKGTRWRH
ncbi:hypothetical protein BDZ91DRAFT_794857 [Kalaharituber pfeilii]|nr:hypothetical protein BDZ91DRAFT_794857 [Kalaharituber pfeilii]